MSRNFYLKLAWTGIQKNKQFYYPYLIAGMAMTAVFYILSFLAASKVVYALRGGEAITEMLAWGAWLTGLFSLPFLIYTSASLIKKRRKELGLYNILGMNKNNILVLLLWETFLSYGIAVFSGIFFGIVCSKAAELGLVNIMEGENNYRIYIEWKSVLSAILCYGGIYFLIFLNTVRQVRHNNPVELLQSESAGERPPKSRWLLVLVGTLITLSAYVMVLRIKEPREAMSQCFLVVAMVIAGTYLLFIAGSVFLCKGLQKNKRYYYKASHFVMISSLSYRMKRNGASLASICILSVMILVTLVFSAGFYTGADSIIGRHYPYDLGIHVEIPEGPAGIGEALGDKYRTEIEETIEEAGSGDFEAVESYCAGLYAPVVDGVLDLGYDLLGEAPEEGIVEEWNKYIEKFCRVRVISVAEYNKLCKAQEELQEGEVLLAGESLVSKEDRASRESIIDQVESVRNWEGKGYAVKEKLMQCPRLSAFRLFNTFPDLMVDQILLVVPDMESFWRAFDVISWMEKNQVVFFWEYDVTLSEIHDGQLTIYNKVSSRLQEMIEAAEEQKELCYSKAEKGDKLKSLAGGLLFLAIVVSLVFVFVATLIMYYKQISEGYEDQKQFSIMRKIGMQKREIRSSINSQMLTVFSLPLFMAGIHLVFALPVIYQLLRQIVVDDKPLLIKVAVVSFLLFAAAYTFVYILTTRTYFRIVNRPVNEKF